jgi:6-pyruvoyltetrahydropterin/6-carboxytetrahydropterin synthase
MSPDRFVEVSTDFNFEAAHYFAHFPEGHANKRLHGHSFRVQITVGGVPDPVSGFVCEFSSLERTASDIRADLDHHLLNEVAGLGPPSLENLAIWIWRRAKFSIPNVSKVIVYRDSCRQSCAYGGPVRTEGREQSYTPTDERFDRCVTADSR